MSKRDDFTPTTKRIMAERVGWRCSFPNCGRITIGPKMGEHDKSLNLGEAAHIVAAAKDGPRFDENTTAEYRKSIHNGIWMCRSHARFIDSDYTEFSVDTLKLWKNEAEERAYELLEQQDSYKFVSKGTLVALGFNIIFEGSWESVDNNIWTFKLKRFIEGDSSVLKSYADAFSSIDRNQRFVSVSSQGDARIIKNPVRIIYQPDGAELISIEVSERVVASLPEHMGSDFMLGDDGDLIVENGEIKLISGIDSAIQSISTSAGMLYGEYFLDRTAGSFISDYYNKYKDDAYLLNEMFKLELIRLSLVPRQNDSDEIINPPLDFIKEVQSVSLLRVDEGMSRAILELKLKLGNGNYWQGNISVYINITKS